MPSYLSPGVYVEEVPSAVQPIAGVGTSTAGFIGVVPNSISIPAPNPAYDPTQATDDEPALRDIQLCAGRCRRREALYQFRRVQEVLRRLLHRRRSAQPSPRRVWLFQQRWHPLLCGRDPATSGVAGILTNSPGSTRIAIVAAPGITDGTVRSAIVRTPR